jgi:hypothetical protein
MLTIGSLMAYDYIMSGYKCKEIKFTLQSSFDMILSGKSINLEKQHENLLGSKIGTLLKSI